MWDDEPAGPFAHQLALARVRRGREVGLLTDGFDLPDFARGVVSSFQDGRRIETLAGELVFAATSAFDLTPDMAAEWPSTEQSNTSVIIGQRAVLKLLRKLTVGVHPEAEMTRVLTERGFANTATLLGEVSQVGEDGTRTVMLLQRFVYNQGDGWTWTLDYLKRTLDEHATSEDAPEDALQGYGALAGQLGRRLAEMHAVLAQPTDDPAFAPETMGEADALSWRAGGRGQRGLFHNPHLKFL